MFAEWDDLHHHEDALCHPVWPLLRPEWPCETVRGSNLCHHGSDDSTPKFRLFCSCVHVWFIGRSIARYSADFERSVFEFWSDHRNSRWNHSRIRLNGNCALENWWHWRRLLQLDSKGEFPTDLWSNPKVGLYPQRLLGFYSNWQGHIQAGRRCEISCSCGDSSTETKCRRILGCRNARRRGKRRSPLGESVHNKRGM